jgi:hypothetical protein
LAAALGLDRYEHRVDSGQGLRVIELEDPSLQGALNNLGHTVARGTIANILKENGIEPAPERRRKTTWREFLGFHWEMIAAADFFTVEVWTRFGLLRYLGFFVIELSSRRVRIAGIHPEPDEEWMLQIGRNLTDAANGFCGASDI